MALIRFGRQGSNPPAWLAMLHGFLAAAGLTLLTVAALTVGIPGLALGGLALLLRAVRRQRAKASVNPSPDGLVTATLRSWQVTYSCKPSE